MNQQLSRFIVTASSPVYPRGKVVTDQPKERGTGPDQFPDSYVSLRNNFADHMYSSLTLNTGPDPKMRSVNPTIKT